MRWPVQKVFSKQMSSAVVGIKMNKKFIQVKKAFNRPEKKMREEDLDTGSCFLKYGIEDRPELFDPK